MQKRLNLVLALIFVLIMLPACGNEDSPVLEESDNINVETSTTITGDTDTATTAANGGSGGSAKTEATTTKKSSDGKTTTTKSTTKKSNTYYAPQVKTNSASGKKVETFSDGSVLDYSNTSDGYVMFKYAGSHSNVRVQVTTPKSSKPVYPIMSKGYEAIPLTDGNGTYTVVVLANDGGNSYTQVGKKEISVSLSSTNAPFLRPNLFVNYTKSTACVKQAAELTRGCDTDIAKIESIFDYVVDKFSYDKSKASSVASTAYVPDLSSVWSSKKGICFDYASTMAAMLRTQGIPTKVCVGNVKQSSNTVYHAWISVYTKESGWVDGVIQFNGSSWKFMDPTFASTGGNTLDWTKKYSYSTLYYY